MVLATVLYDIQFDFLAKNTASRYIEEFMQKQNFIRSRIHTLEENIYASFSDVIVEGKSISQKESSRNNYLVWKYSIKRFMDLSLSGILLIVSFPLFIIIAVLIKLTSKGPVLFRQTRIGLKGKSFQIYKFRTMKFQSNEQEHSEYVKYLLKEGTEAPTRADLVGNYIALVEQKTTPFGRLLRASSLDELPQLINILSGNMSLVGPRPHPVYEVNEYKKWYRRRLDMKPGLTGWSKLNLRMTPNNYEEAILYDLWYIDNWSIRLDVRIVLLTIPFVLFGNDAH
jgi:lipopolysaccharide/colanic/teichoic acid biosynthesis glycosyltransferase